MTDLLVLDEYGPAEAVLNYWRHHAAKQECNECGKQFSIMYFDDGTYEYIQEPCRCEAPFHPVDGELSIGEWLEKLKKG